MGRRYTPRPKKQNDRKISFILSILVQIKRASQHDRPIIVVLLNCFDLIDLKYNGRDKNFADILACKKENDKAY